MSASLSWMCSRGPHWCCPKCAPNGKCLKHETRCVSTGSLWYTTIANMTNVTIVCGNGCVDVAGGGCKCGMPSQIYNSGSIGTFKDRGIMVAIQQRKGAVTTVDGITVAPTGTPMQVELMSDTRYANTPFNIHITAEFTLGNREHVELKTQGPVRGPTGTIAMLEIVSHTSRNTRHLLNLVWTHLQFTAARAAPAPRPYTGCTHRRRSRGAVVSPAADIIWGVLGGGEAATVLPPGYTRSADGVVLCVWCHKDFPNKQTYNTECAQDVGL